MRRGNPTEEFCEQVSHKCSSFCIRLPRNWDHVNQDLSEILLCSNRVIADIPVIPMAPYADQHIPGQQPVEVS